MNKLKLIVAAAFALALLALPGAAMARDRDHDKMPDKWEKKHHLSTHKNNAKKDPDKDGLSNLEEFRHHSDPRDADTDNDGLNDGDEVEVGDNPRDEDSNNDGVEDGDETAGTIQHFDSATNTLTITKTDGTTVSGTVTDATRIECEDESGDLSKSSHGSDDASGDDNSGSGDNSGPGSTSSDDAGDDHGDDNGDGKDDNRQACTTADLTDGRVVHEAELASDGNGGNTFTKVELDRA